MDKAIPDGSPVGCAVLRIALNAGNPDILPKSGKKLRLQRVNASTQFHRNSSNHISLSSVTRCAGLWAMAFAPAASMSAVSP